LAPEQRARLNKDIQQFIEKGHFSKELISSTVKKIVPTKA